MNEHAHLIAGREIATRSGRTFLSKDPSDDTVVARFAAGGADEVDRAVRAAREASESWSETPAAERGRMLGDVARRITADSDTLARQESRDCGKPLSQAHDDIRIASRYFEFFGGAAAVSNGEQIPVGAQALAFTSREPHGVCAQINAWNFPLNMAARSLAPALAAGNTVVVKTPELAPVTTALLGRIVTEAGFPAGVVNIVHGSGAEAGAALAAHPDVDMVTFTGSIETGRQVAQGAAPQLTPTVMELGGKSPVIVFADADLDEVAEQLAYGFIEANGQSCDLPSLALVDARVRDDFVQRMARHVEKLTLGPALGDPDVGPLISSAQQSRVNAYIAGARTAGATVVTGGDRVDRTGWFVPPTVISDVTPAMDVFREEIFGPVLSVATFTDEAEAIRLANTTGYGLAAFVWTGDARRGTRVARRVAAGQVYLNCFSSGDSAMTPFGGFNASGHGREKGFEALRTYSRTKLFCISSSQIQEELNVS